MHANPGALRIANPPDTRPKLSVVSPPEVVTGPDAFLIVRIDNFERPAAECSERNMRVERALIETVGRPQIITWNLSLGQTVMIVQEPLPRLAQLKRALNGMNEILIGHGSYI